MRCCIFHFRYVTNKIVFTLQVYSARSDSLFSILSIFRTFRLEKWIVMQFIEASSEIGRKIKYLQANQRTGQNT